MTLASHHPAPNPVLAGQESVWDYPRPQVAEQTARHIRIICRDVVLADTCVAWRTLETSHPPTYYIPQSDIAMAHLVANSGTSFCEWKGQARYWDVVVGDTRLVGAGWSYPRPSPRFAGIANHIAFYAAPFDQVLIDGEQVTPQPGGFYGGWVTAREAGPFKGVPGSQFW